VIVHDVVQVKYVYEPHTVEAGVATLNVTGATPATSVVNVSVPTFEMLHRFIFRFPVIVVPDKLVTVNALRVVVPTGTLKPPLDTVTFPPADGLSTILLLDAI
jgi:hypothetical protein